MIKAALYNAAYPARFPGRGALNRATAWPFPATGRRNGTCRRKFSVKCRYETETRSRPDRHLTYFAGKFQLETAITYDKGQV
jgi:hypothetical protein